MAYNRFRKKARLKRQYTFTKSKMAVGFVLSTFFSIMLSPYFERYWPVLVEQTGWAIMELSYDADELIDPTTAEAVEAEPEIDEIAKLDERLREIQAARK